MLYCCIRKKRSILGIRDVHDEEDYYAFEDSPPFINPKSVEKDDIVVGYMRVDHIDGNTFELSDT